MTTDHLDVAPSCPAGATEDDPSNGGTSSPFVTVIEPRSGWRLVDWKEIWQYRDLYQFLVWRGIRARYAQSALGIGWAIIQPLFSMVVFTVVFGRLAKVSSDGVPYAIFSFVALVPWTYFANAVTEGTQSLVTNANMLKKVYFPRLILPMAAVTARLVDFTIAMTLLFALVVFYGVVPNLGLVALPFLILLMALAASGIGLWLTALAVQYRDVNYGINFLVQLLMYASPVVYPTTLIPDRYQLWYSLNPMVGVIEGFRSAILGTRPMPWGVVSIGTATATFLFLTGIFYFRRRERLFADVA